MCSAFERDVKLNFDSITNIISVHGQVLLNRSKSIYKADETRHMGFMNITWISSPKIHVR